MRPLLTYLAIATLAAAALAGEDEGDKQEESLKDKALTAVREGRFRSAIATMSTHLDSKGNEKDAEAHFALGVSFYAIGRHTAAIEYLAMAEAHGFDEGRTQVIMALARHAIERPDNEWQAPLATLRGEQKLRPVIFILTSGRNPGDDAFKDVKDEDKALVLSLAGVALYEMGWADAAEKTIEDLLKLAPKEPPLEYALAKAISDQIKMEKETRKKLDSTIALSKIKPLSRKQAREMIDKKKKYLVVLDTSEGRVEIELMSDSAPYTSANFLHLVRNGFYDDLKFHRVLSNFMAQGGCPLGTGSSGPGWTVQDEVKGRKDNKHERGSVAMALTGTGSKTLPNTAGSQFYICYDKAEHLDKLHTVFGRVTRGMEAVERFNQDVTKIKSATAYEVDRKKAEKKENDK